MIDNNDLDLVERALREVCVSGSRWGSLASPDPLITQLARVCWRMRNPEGKMLKPYDYHWARRRLDALASEGRITYRRGWSFYEFRNHHSGRYVRVHRRFDRLPVLTERRTTNA